MIRRYLLDTGIAQDFQEDRHGVLDRAIAEHKMGIVSAFAFPYSVNFGPEWNAAPAGNVI
jgi:hypothetical protein